LTSALVEGERSASRSGHFTHVEKSPGIHCTAGWVAPESVWTTCRSEHSCPYRDWNSDPSVTQPVASRYIDCATTVLFISTVYSVQVYKVIWQYLRKPKKFLGGKQPQVTPLSLEIAIQRESALLRMSETTPTYWLYHNYLLPL
jgi:hypothetical protein